MKSITVRLVYLYLFAAIGLVVVVIGLISGVNLGIKTVFFKDADSYQTFYPTYPGGDQKLSKEELDQQKKDFEVSRKIDIERSRQRDLSNSIAMIIIGTPLFLYHWKVIQKENGQR
jgi:hypothetical protein